MNHTLSDSQLEAMVKSAVNSFGPLPPDEKFSQLISALRELQERRKADSEPVAWLAIYHGEVYDEAIGITRSVVEAQADHFGWESALTEIIPLYRHAQQPVVPPMQHWEELCREHPDMSIGDAIIRAAWWNHCRAAMLQSGNSPAQNPGWIPVSERLPEVGGRYWCYVEEQNSLGKSHYQWNCSWNGEIWGGAMMYGRVTHWMPLPAAPREVKGE